MSTKTLAASLDNDLAEWGEGRINDLFDHFLPLLEKYLPLEPTATYLIQSKLLTRKEYFHLKDDEGKRAQIYNDGSFVKRLVDIVANKGPKAFVLFFNALEFCRDDSNDCHLGLEHVIKEIRQFLEENGLIAQVNADRELDADERDAHEWRMTRPYRSKFRVRSTDSLLSSGYGSVSSFSSELLQSHVSGFAEQVARLMEEQVASSVLEQLAQMEKELCAAKELNEGLALANGKLKEENSALAIKLDASLSSLVRAENECAEHKKEIERLKNADCRKPRHLLTRQYSCDSNCSSSSEQSTEGEYYAPAMNFEPFTSRNDLYGIPSVQFELPRLPKKVTSRRSCLSNSKRPLQILIQRCKSFNDHCHSNVFHKLRKCSSIPSALSTCGVKPLPVLSREPKLLSSLSKPISGKIPFLMVSTV